MTTTIEYALMAGASYYDTRFDINRFPTPTGWNWISRNPQDNATGFEAAAFGNGTTLATSTEIVISFAGTYDKDYLGDWVADVKLATGYSHAQLLQAAQYYLDVQRQNPGATITLTGHSLGGGLAALVGVFFHVSATTFDQAPFANSAQSDSLLSNPLNILTPDVAAELKTSLLTAGYTEAELAPLTNFLLIRPTDGSIPNSNLVNNIRVDGEFLSSLPIGLYDTIGNPATVITHGPHFEPSIDLHDQALLTDFLMSDATAQTVAGQKQSFSEATKKLTDLLGMIFDGRLYSYRTDDPNHVNLLEHLVRHEAGVQGAFVADAMVARFTADLWKIAQDGGLTLNEAHLSRALTAFAMQKYYDETQASAGYNKTLFTGVAGGIQFDIKDVASTPTAAKGYADFRLFLEQYYTTVTTDITGASVVTVSPNKAQILAALGSLRDWYIQAGADAMNATDTFNRNAFMFGNTGNDTLTGGTGNDLLVGNAGADNLTGGAGDDQLIGGAADDTLDGGADYDTYTLEGRDTIRDSDGSGILKDKAGNILSGVIQKNADGSYAYLNDPSASVTLDSNLTLTLTLAGGATAVLENFHTGNLGLQLADTTTPTTGLTLTGDFAPIVYGTDTNGDPIYHYDSLNNLITDPGTPEAGRADWLYGDTGDDLIMGKGGSDILYGSSGGDRLYADSETGVADAIALGNNQTGSGLKGDWLSGGDGDDTLISGTDNDALLGGGGSDLLIGGAGNDYIMGDTDAVATSFDWALTNINGTQTFFPALERPAVGAADTIYAGEEADHVWAGAGGDIVYGETGADKLSGEAGNDILFGGTDNDTLWGGNGDDVLAGGIDDDDVQGFFKGILFWRSECEAANDMYCHDTEQTERRAA